MTVEHDADLAPHTTFRVPARAKALARFSTVDDLRQLLATPELKDLSRLILGGGSNVLFTHDWPGVVLLNELPGVAVVHEDGAHVWLKAGAGVPWHELVMHTVERGWGGLENLSLIPGKVGAAPMQNIGAYGVELKDHFAALEALKIDDGTVVTFRPDDCRFGYRESFFKREGRDRFVILNVTFRLHKHPVLSTGYGAIRDVLAERGITAPTVRDISDAVVHIRRSKLPDPAVLGNAGSFFKNPIVPVALADRIKSAHPGAPVYPAGDGQAKLAAGWLIEQAGWKGHRDGACGVHDRQALVLVNHGGATGRDVFDLSERILRDMQARFGVELEREVNIL
ncbi:MAG TPA: UDP-N-acetylmuramate dehydrogenase [Flavobacteriales bacterium]|nr:UDP-N-acetylmuramate dehydrogenase [Flavobacteriales bacterium]HMR29044.1 UDP-N-acetylmuramate dehydrogenase [Flavobacteriales bacterium]